MKISNSANLRSICARFGDNIHFMYQKLDTEPRNRQNPPIPKQGVIFKTWGYSQGKSTLKWNFSAYKKRFLNWNNIFKRIKQLLAKLRSLWYVHLELPILFIFLLASERAILYGKVVLKILVLSTFKSDAPAFLKRFLFSENWS